jgi:hypothetical protein
MPTVNRFQAFELLLCVLFALMLPVAQATPATAINRSPKNDENQARPNTASNASVAGGDYSGMYKFLREGEFVQITIEDEGHVIGFVSRYADPEAEGGFLDQFLKSGKLDSNRIAFNTETVEGVSFEFHGTIERGDGASRGDEGYYVLKGSLLENRTNKSGKNSSSSRDVALKSFPQDVAPRSVLQK